MLAEDVLRRRVLARALRSRARAAKLCGGPGAAGNRVARPAGDTTCLACPPPFSIFCLRSILHHIGFRSRAPPRDQIHQHLFSIVHKCHVPNETAWR